MKFDMNRCWSDAMALLSGNLQYLALIAGIFFLLPNLLLLVAFPELMSGSMDPAADPEQILQQFEGLWGMFAGIILVTMLASTIGYAAMVALLGNSRPTVGEALSAAFSALPALIGVIGVTILAYIVALIPLSLIIAVFMLVFSLILGEIGAAFVSVIVCLIALLFIAVRFVLVTPAVMLDGIRNPFAAFGRSWKLTADDHKRIFLFFVLIMIAYLVIAMIIGGLAGVLTAMAGTFIGGLINGLLSVIAAIVFTAILVAMHKQLAGTVAEDITETFE